MKALVVAALAAGTVLSAPVAIANALPPNCQSQPWGFLGSQIRQLCDGPIRPDGSWMRRRVEGRPAYYQNAHSSCSYGDYSGGCTYYPAGPVAEVDTDDETYVVTPDTVLPDEPGHIG